MNISINEPSTSLLKQALAHAVRQTTGQDVPALQKAWLTRFGVYALYPAIYKEMAVFLEEHGVTCTTSTQQTLPEKLYAAGLISKPRGFGVRQTRSTCVSILNLVFEIDPDHIWCPGESRPELWYLTPAVGQWYAWVANLAGLTSRPADQQRLYLHTVRAKPLQPPEETPNSANPDVVLAIYWQVQEFEGDPDAKSIWS
ncbi:MULTISPECIES: hypothetical protein [Pseudomonas syringae group genomosp. 2]|uniref:hypothetical protein n=1 Tax=Pseudomonas syringae group genomosp. 2 TaxID=251698 RepID=UPI0001CC3B4B|nr:MULTISPECIES: hypothetical protein [Pseudomonas syringae group genomosp. 2]EGH04760.1 hypothetical protein PSYAE_22928 [Pseudomonas amygdali pv. aesculi str. 0893_23]KPW10469.1 Uncharacterized protein ALO90_04236 [Pseudomonas amygdali pv. aesculi]KWT08293.1 hypothetical protein AL041_22960 [Pseudomonas amygdali pv. aesculi]KWT19436.1 hypothetical protein AL043_04080 [Pseudomonas amygdali pv. aesculi]KWT20314.1 hypothetical protein AL042_25870 [Pseudomonas amygdali pv. aesculi]